MTESTPPPAPGPPAPGPAGQPAAGSGMSITALILGIVAVALAFIPLVPILPVGLGIAAIVLGILGRKRQGRGMATAGLWLGVAAIVISIVINLLLVGWMMSS